jgi:replicative DNA helicase
MSVKEHLEFLAKESEKIKDAKSQMLIRGRAEELLAQYNGDDKVVSSFEIREQLKDKPLPPPLPTGHPKLDSIIKGFYPGQHIVFSAPPKSGKTSFILDLISRMKYSDPALIPLEQSAEELISVLNERKLEIPLFYAPRSNKLATLEWVEQRITEAVVKHGSKVVFLDHFGYIKNDGQQQHLQIIDTMQRLRSIAKQLNISIVSIVHVRKVSPIEPPSIEDLYGGAGYLQEADTVVMMWREAYKEGKEIKWTNKVLVSVQANRRNGSTGNFRMKYDNYKFIQDDNIQFHHEGATEELDDF